MALCKDILQDMFTYEQGKLYWNYSPRANVKTGDEAGSTDAYGYVCIKINQKIYKAHRLIYIMFNGHIPNRLQIDHINGIRNDNRIENLRVVTNQQNQFNKKVKGVDFHKKTSKWRARITRDKQLHHLGLFDTEEEARQAYLKAKKIYHKY